MVVIANPIYDSVFKFLMEDKRVAKILLSALLQKEVVDVKIRPHEFSNKHERTSISMFRIDFSARVKDADGSSRVILIELQKTWRATESLRFRQYLGTQYLSKDNVPDLDEDPKGYGYPIVSIYILGHKVGDITEPVIYVRRSYLDSDSNPIVNGVPDPFVESLTHDSIIVQIPYLRGRMRNRLERLLSVFDQNHRRKGDNHLMDFNDENLTEDEAIVVHRLTQAAASPEMARNMQIEDEFLSELEERDTALMKAKEKLAKRDEELELQKKKIEHKDKELEDKNKELESKDRAISAAVRQFAEMGMPHARIAQLLDISETEVRQVLNEK